MPAPIHAVDKIDTYLLHDGCLFAVICACGWVSAPCRTAEGSQTRHAAHVAVSASREGARAS